ncbi:MAG: glycosyltransferase, partial [Vulcanimicrobiaceae bacterium]
MNAGLHVALTPGPPHLSQLATDRLALLLPAARFDRQTDPALPLLHVRPDVIVDPDALQSFVGTAFERGHAVRAAAKAADGTVIPGAATLWPPGSAREGPFHEVDQPIGVAAFEQPIDRPLDRGALTAFAPALGVSGYATASRNLLLGLRSLGVDAAWQAEWGDVAAEAVDPDEAARLLRLAKTGRPDDPVMLYRPATNADGTAFFEIYRERRTRAPVVACTMFETDALPQRWPSVLNTCEQVWVPSTFNRRTFAEHGVDAERLRVVPIGLDMWSYDPDGERGPLPERRTTAFLSAFEWSERKGTDVLLRAWAHAFRPSDDVVLYLRTGTESEHAETVLQDALAATRLRREDLAPIVLLHAALSQAAYRALIRSIDVFVLTSRGEGFCIPMLEAMALGKPVIGTVYGGSSDFLDEDTGFTIPSRLVPITRAFSQRLPLYRGQRWAAPAVDATARALRAVIDDAGDARRRAARAFARAHE